MQFRAKSKPNRSMCKHTTIFSELSAQCLTFCWLVFNNLLAISDMMMAKDLASISQGYIK